jgi:hypothetical protein
MESPQTGVYVGMYLLPWVFLEVRWHGVKYSGEDLKSQPSENRGRDSFHYFYLFFNFKTVFWYVAQADLELMIHVEAKKTHINRARDKRLCVRFTFVK